MGAVVCLRLGVAIAVLTAGTARAQSGAPERAQPHEMRDREHDEGRQIGVVGEVKRVDRATGRTWIAVHGEEFSFDLPRQIARDFAPGDQVAITLERDSDSTGSQGSGTFATDPETGTPGSRSPAAETR